MRYIKIGDHRINLDRIGGISRGEWPPYESAEKIFQIVVYAPATTFTAFEGTEEECDRILATVDKAIEVT